MVLKLGFDPASVHDHWSPPRDGDPQDRYAVEPVAMSPTAVYSSAAYDALDVVDPADSTHSTVLHLGHASNRLTGVVSLPGNALAYADDRYQVRECSPCVAGSAYHEEVIAGADAHVPRPTYDPTPASVSAADLTLSARAAPIGVRSDGSVVIVDATTVWGLKNGLLTRIYQRAADHPDSHAGQPWLDAMPVGRVGAVDPHGTIWLAPEARGDQSRLGDVIGVDSSGAATPLSVPASISGVNGRPADLLVWSIVSDGADGLYLATSAPSTSDQYLIHLKAGDATVLAASTMDFTKELSSDIRARGVYDPLSIPVFLPTGIAVLPGMILMTGSADYVVAIAVR